MTQEKFTKQRTKKLGNNYKRYGTKKNQGVQQLGCMNC